MYLSSRTDIAEGPLPVPVIPGEPPFASIDLSDGCDLRLHSGADCDRLIIAATTAKRRLEAAIAGKPHEFRAAADGYCDECGQRRSLAVHQAGAAS